MNAVEKAGRGFGCALASLAYPVLFALIVAVHIWTVVIAVQMSGIFAAVISFILPVLAEIYWCVRQAQEAEGFFNSEYCMANLSLLVAWIVVFAGSRLAGVADPEATARGQSLGASREPDPVPAPDPEPPRTTSDDKA